MAQPSAYDIKKALKLIRSEANRKFGKDWSLIIGNQGSMQIEARRHSEGKVIQSILWVDGRLEARTTMAR